MYLQLITIVLPDLKTHVHPQSNLWLVVYLLRPLESRFETLSPKLYPQIMITRENSILKVPLGVNCLPRTFL